MTEIIVRDETLRDRAIDLIGKLDLSKPWRITVERYRRKRTLGQNALLHRYFGIIARETGNSPEDIKEAYRDMFLPKVPVRIGDEERLIGQSTTKLDTKQMSELVDKVYHHAASELGILLPLAEEAHLEDA